MNQHLRLCIKKTKENITVFSSQPITAEERVSLTNSNFKWGEQEGAVVVQYVHDAYEKIVFFRKNLFLLPSGSAEKAYINEVTRLVNAWNNNWPT